MPSSKEKMMELDILLELQIFYMMISLGTIYLLIGLAELFYWLYHFIEDKIYRECLLTKLLNKLHVNIKGETPFLGGAAMCIPLAGICIFILAILVIAVIGIRAYRRKLKKVKMQD